MDKAVESTALAATPEHSSVSSGLSSEGIQRTWMALGSSFGASFMATALAATFSVRSCVQLAMLCRSAGVDFWLLSTCTMISIHAQ
jgi:hypothetical protein